MTERQSFEIAEMKERVFRHDRYCCRHCGKSIYWLDTPQVAHGIHKSKANIKKYGAEIVHSIHNLYSACSLNCNDALNVGVPNEEKEAERIRRIIDETL